MKKTILLSSLASLLAIATPTKSDAALIFSQTFTGGADSWTQEGGGTMTTGDLSEAFTSTSSSLAPLITEIAGDTDARTATLSAWFKLPASTAANLFTVKSTGGTTASIDNFGGYSLTTDASGAATLNQTGNSAAALATVGSSAWTQVALVVTKQASARLLDINLYVNGALWGNATAPADTVAGSNLNGNGFTGLNIGQAGISIANLEVYDQALTESEVQMAYATQMAVPEPSVALLGGFGLLGLLRRRRA